MVMKANPSQRLDRDAWLIDAHRAEFQRCVEEAGASAAPLEPHLRFLRRVNLAGLLQRLDSATMLAGVEGRTPFADCAVAAFGESLPIASRFDAGDGRGAGHVAVATRASTKIALREAFRTRLLAGVADRPKASFPLPFQQWIGPLAWRVEGSTLLQELLAPHARAAVVADPERRWQFAWPAINLALWSTRWWG